MDLRITRTISLAVVPFIASASIVGTGFALWIFGEPGEVTSAANVTSTLLEVTGASPFPDQLTILRPTYFDGYRIVLDQGGSDAQYDELRGVSLNTPLQCMLTGYGLDSWEDLKVQYKLTCSNNANGCLFDDTVRFAQYQDASNTDTSRIYTLSEQVVNTPTVSNGGTEIFFSLNPSFAWHRGMKPTVSVGNSSEGTRGWGELIHELNALNTTHTLWITITNEE